VDDVASLGTSQNWKRKRKKGKKNKKTKPKKKKNLADLFSIRVTKMIYQENY
jgi:hypothetical protein